MGGEHTCTQVGEITVIKNMIAEIQTDRAYQDTEREKRLIARAETDRVLTEKLAELKEQSVAMAQQNSSLILQMQELLELNKDVKNIKIAWKVGGNVGSGLAKFILAITIILGAIYGLKEWINR